MQLATHLCAVIKLITDAPTAATLMRSYHLNVVVVAAVDA